ncbi:MAG: hypothetical protein IMW92_14415 [Bacillales bacterium]|nr:hypothetical protein [Bacillales bacterium]
MEWRPNKLHKLPLYKKIANYLESRIINGEFPPGSRSETSTFFYQMEAFTYGANLWMTNWMKHYYSNKLLKTEWFSPLELHSVLIVDI